jgi:ABC-type polar amino acid transport system ATPase subunit
MNTISGSQPEIAVSVRSVAKSFGALVALHDVSLDIRRGEILGVIGPSGGGKSTLLRCLDGLEQPNSGSIEYFLDGQTRIDSTSALTSPSLTELRRLVGFVFQGLNLWEDRSVLENLALAPRLVTRSPRGEIEDRARTLCRRFGLEAKLHARTWELSGGEQQRAAIIRALMMRPRLVLLDEVTSALDPVLTVDVMNAIRQLRDEGLTLVVVTHHIEFASQLCDRILFLAAGRVVQLAAPSALRASPANAEVSRFLDLLVSAR